MWVEHLNMETHSAIKFDNKTIFLPFDFFCSYLTYISHRSTEGKKQNTNQTNDAVPKISKRTTTTREHIKEHQETEVLFQI